MSFVSSLRVLLTSRVLWPRPALVNGAAASRVSTLQASIRDARPDASHPALVAGYAADLFRAPWRRRWAARLVSPAAPDRNRAR